MCGIFGFAGKTPVKIDKFKILGLYNQSRGEDSCGYATHDVIQHGVDGTKTWSSFLYNEDIDAENSLAIIGHVRKKTVGLATKANAHPFNISLRVTKGKKSNTHFLRGCHNGAIKNAFELCSKKNVSTKGVEVDSHAFFCALAMETIPKNDAVSFKLFEEYIGVGAFAWLYSEEPDVVYLFRGESKLDRYAPKITEERPMYTFSTEDGVYFSSMWEALYAIGGDEKNVIKLPENVVFRIKDGVLEEVAKTERGAVGQQLTPYVSPSTTHTYYPDNTSTPVGPFSAFFKKEELAYTRVPVPAIDIEQDVCPKHLTTTGKIYFSKGKFHKTGHVLDSEKPFFVDLESGEVYNATKTQKNKAQVISVGNKVYNRVFFREGAMFDEHKSNLRTNFHAIFPARNSNATEALFYFKGSLANGEFTPMNGTKTYMFNKGLLVAIIDKHAKNITHRKSLVIGQQEIPFSTKNVEDKSDTTDLPSMDQLECLPNLEKVRNTTFIQDFLQDTVDNIGDLSYCTPLVKDYIYNNYYVDPVTQVIWTYVNTAYSEIVWVVLAEYFLDPKDLKIVAKWNKSLIDNVIPLQASNVHSGSEVLKAINENGVKTIKPIDFVDTFVAYNDLKIYVAELKKLTDIMHEQYYVTGTAYIQIPTTFTAIRKKHEALHTTRAVKSFSKPAIITNSSKQLIAFKELVNKYEGNAFIWNDCTDFLDYSDNSVFRAVLAPDPMFPRGDMFVRFHRVAYLHPKLNAITVNIVKAHQESYSLKELENLSKRNHGTHNWNTSWKAWENLIFKDYRITGLYTINMLMIDGYIEKAVREYLAARQVTALLAQGTEAVVETDAEEDGEVANELFEKALEIQATAKQALELVGPDSDKLNDESKLIYDTISKVNELMVEVGVEEDMEEEGVEDKNGRAFEFDNSFSDSHRILKTHVPVLQIASPLAYLYPSEETPINLSVKQHEYLTEHLLNKGIITKSDMLLADGTIYKKAKANTYYEAGSWWIKVSSTNGKAINFEFHGTLSAELVEEIDYELVMGEAGEKELLQRNSKLESRGKTLAQKYPKATQLTFIKSAK